MDLKIKRRYVLRSAGAFLALAPAGALAFSASRSFARNAVNVPAGRFTLRRVLERGLSDGKAIIVSRQWACSIEPLGAGGRVTGQQTAVEVDVPPVLSAMAELERNRKVTGFLPAELDRTGRIVLAGMRDNDEAPIQAAAITAADLFREMPGKIGADSAREFLQSVSRTAASLVSRVPPDLFFPTPGQSSDTRQMPLADGETGEIAISMVASVAPDTGLLDASQRTIVTRVANAERISRESWTLIPA